MYRLLSRVTAMLCQACHVKLQCNKQYSASTPNLSVWDGMRYIYEPQLAGLYLDNHCITGSTSSTAASSTAEQQFSSIDQFTIP